MEVFELETGDGSGPRAGLLRLPSGRTVHTPLFMPVATKLSVKTLDPLELKGTGTTTLITNGFLSHLEPGTDVIRRMGGMHTFMGWDGGLFSDSGGFQLIRRGFNARVTDQGVHLRSPFSGEPIFLTPEEVVDLHVAHGVDVGMVLDHCPAYGSTEQDILDAAKRTYEWAKRSKEHCLLSTTAETSPHDDMRVPLIFAITQGGTYKDIREENTRKLVGLDFPGYGVGGLSIGEGKGDMFRSLEASTSLLPPEKPRYFMGVGEPVDLVRSVLCGVDIFDSVFPTRNARHRSLLTPEGKENLRAGRWKGVEGPIFEGCGCTTCERYSRAYLYHLFKAREPLGPRLATVHNLHFMQTLLTGLRKLMIESEDPGRAGPEETIQRIFQGFIQ
ncbi:MAG: tRNA guanosine(34) transglycosylase Tgt [Candidatus Thermoplasmatota archaeon]|nr:tRNA guanosine(34) transglycosylase Tgt [Candidatus Thermoplasmatota archaeon]